jgi:hypothetical protein
MAVSSCLSLGGSETAEKVRAGVRVVGESPPANENHRRTSVLRGKIKDLIDILDITGL